MGKVIKYPESDITREIEKDGLKVYIHVYKADEGVWILEVEDEHWNSNAWDEILPSAKEALDTEALDTGTKSIEEEGIQAFIGDSKA